ncbi:MAG: DNA helicase UvrD [Chitinophagaceae bacterium]|nr:DNA helicase UvrD [Chitinophagaceae bacterium]
MFYRADLHIHSHYAKATSPQLTLELLDRWAQIKGIRLLGTGDFTHPAWLKEIKEKLLSDEDGFFHLKTGGNTRFCLSTEISSVYVYGNKVRKNHNLVYMPDIDTVERFNKKLSKYGDLSLDGRPTVTLSSRDLLEMVLEISDRAHLVPAHAWTPWFSTLGSKGGYDSIEECFRDLTPGIFAIETGLSSDPAMNWQWSKLDHLAMMSSSDAHSLHNLGREVNLFDTDFTYDAMFNAVKNKKGFSGTYEFFPEEGKYSFDGHRKCGISMPPALSNDINAICPVCKKQLTIGVMSRVSKLSDRSTPIKPADAPVFEYIIPLREILAEINGTSVNSIKVEKAYTDAVAFFGNEFALLKEASVDDIRKYNNTIAEAIYRMRTGKVNRVAGYDGIYGRITLFENGELLKAKTTQIALFG